MTGPLVQAIGWALLHLLWQGVLVAAILAATLALLRRQSANTRYLASCGALLLLVGLGIATAYRMYEPAVTTTTTNVDVAPLTANTYTFADAAPAVTFSFLSFISAHLEEIVAIWLVGVVILSARLIFGWIGARRLARRGTLQASEQWQRSLWRIASTLRLWRPIELLESAAVEVPTVIGWLRPVVLLPMASLSGLSTQQIEMVLAHELAHIRRHDFIVNLIQSVVETLLFYHPAVWWISQRVRVEREHCCDDLAVSVFGDPLQYARALTRFEELRVTAAQNVLAANGGSLLTRIRRLVVARAESANWSSRWAAGAALITVVAAMLAAPALPVFANHEEQTPPPPSHASADAPKAKKAKCEDPKKCDKAAKSEVDVHADTDVDVDADMDTDVDTDTESDDNMDAEAQIAPEQPTPPPTPMAVVSPRIAVSVAPFAPGESRVRTRRRHIGEGGKLSVDDLIALRTAGVTPKYIDEMRSQGIGDLSLDDVVELRMQGVTPDYIKAMASAGYTHLTAQNLVELRAMGVSPQFIKSLSDAGYSNLSVKELVNLRASGVDAEFIRELSKYRSK
jgi:beta-lactamase regulating signal transducer with metallopeptidase domain